MDTEPPDGVDSHTVAPALLATAFGFDAVFSETPTTTATTTTATTATTTTTTATRMTTSTTTTSSTAPITSVPLILSTSSTTDSSSCTVIMNSSNPESPEQPTRKRRRRSTKAPSSQSNTIPSQTKSIFSPSSSDSDSSIVPDKPSLPPPLALQDAHHFPTIRRHLLSLKLNKSFEAATHPKKRTVLIQTFTMPDYHKIKSYLSQQKFNYNTWRPETEKTFRVVIRGLVNNTDINELETELTDKGLTITQVLQLRNNQTKTAIPLFLVELPVNKPNRKIYTLSKILSQKVTVEPENRQGPPICTRCLDYSHTNKYCERRPRCGACAGSHLMADCKKPAADPPRCANCGGPHKAIWKGCPNYQKFIARDNPPTQPNPNPPPPIPPQTLPKTQPPTHLPQRNAWTHSTPATKPTRTDINLPLPPTSQTTSQERPMTQPSNPIPPRNDAPAGHQHTNAPLTDILTAAREFMTFFNEARGLINLGLELIRSFRSGGLPALLTTLTDILTTWG